MERPSHSEQERASGLPRRARILLVGDFVWPWLQAACADALEALGHEVVRFGWGDNFFSWRSGSSAPGYQSLFLQIQYHFQFGPEVWQINQRLIKVAERCQPEIVWFYNVQLITPATVKKLRQVLPDATFCQYANDDPFSQAAKPGLWRHYLGSIPYFDIHYVFRHCNVPDYQRYGATNIRLLRSYFIPAVHYPEAPESIPARYQCDVVFAGHYEDDGRVQLLEAICDAGYSLNLFGGEWSAALPKLRADSPLRSKLPVSWAIDADYRYALCGAKVCLALLSRLNHDTYTQRCFEIPACGGVLLAERTCDLRDLFKEDKEACFFSSAEELVAKVKWLIDNPVIACHIAQAGQRRVWADGHDVKSRMKELHDSWDRCF